MHAMTDVVVAGQRIAVLMDALKRDPVFAMSLGSKELFHSNLLGWFIEHHPAVAEAVTEESGPVTVKREKQNTDLLILADGRPPLVIENKVFSLPDWEQLERIAGKFAGRLSRLVLLSLTRPSWSGDSWPTSNGDVWTLLTYNDLVRRLRPVIKEVSAADPYAGATLGRWLDMVDRLGELAAVLGQPTLDEPLQLPRSHKALLHEARLDAAVQKMRYQAVAVELGKRGLDPLALEVNHSNGTGMVDWFTESPHGFRWGWQLQGEEFRLAIVVPESHPGYGKSAQHWAARQEEAHRHPDLFEFGPITGADAEGPTRGGVRFGRFNPNFIYRYVRIPSITVGQAVELGIEHARRITTVLR